MRHVRDQISLEPLIPDTFLQCTVQALAQPVDCLGDFQRFAS